MSSLIDILKPPALPKRKGKVVHGPKRSVEEEARKAKTLAEYEARQRQERAAGKAARMKALNADPEFKAKTAARMKALHADPEFKAKTAARMKALHADPEFKAKVSKAASARMKALNADPEFKAERAKRLALSRLERAKAAYIEARKAAGLDHDSTEVHQQGSSEKA